MDYNLGYYHGIGSKSATDNHHKHDLIQKLLLF